MLHYFKEGLHVVGIDDAIHSRGEKHTELVFVFCRGTVMEHFLHAPIQVDGEDSTRVIIDTLEPHKKKFRLIFLHGITVGGFNMVDIQQVATELERPVIGLTENKPSDQAIMDAISKLPPSSQERKKHLLNRAGTLHSVFTGIGTNPVYFHLEKIERGIAEQYIKEFTIRSRLPECILLAHIIGKSL